MPIYSYIDTKGNKKETEAADPYSAIANAPDRATTSGVRLVKEPTLAEGVGTPVPTQSTDLSRFTQRPESDLDKARGNYQSYLERLAGGKDDTYEKSRKVITDQMRREIAATEDIYADLVRRAEIQTEGERGSARAIQSRGGLLGSDFASSQNTKIAQQGNDIIRGIEAEKSAALAAIIGEGKRSLIEELRLKREAEQKSLKDYVDFLETEQDRKMSRANSLVNALLAQGIDVEDLTPEQLNLITKSYNVDNVEVLSQFNQLREEGAVDEFRAIGAGSSIFNPKTGEIVGTAPRSSSSSSSSRSSNYTGTTIPESIDADLRTDIIGGGTLPQLLEAYPDVSASYVRSQYNSLSPETGTSDEDDPLSF